MSHRLNSRAPLRSVLIAACLCVGLLLALVAGPSAQAAALPTITVTANASSMTVGGTLQSGGVNVVSTVTGFKGEPSVILFLLKPGVTAAELFAALESKQLKDPNNASKYGSIVFDAEAPPGKPSEAQTELQPGQYAAVVLPGEEHGPSKKVHTSFTVTAAAAPVSLPAPQATIKTIEFGFRGPTTLHDGELVRFENAGFLVHMDVAGQVKNEASAKKAVKALLAGREKETEKLFIGGVGFAGPLSPGAWQQEMITAKPGWYVQACFMETQDGRDHTRLGMERIIKIVK